jgi:hypothetical protein
MSIATYQNIQIRPYQLKDLLDLKIIKRLNEHARLSFTGVIPVDKKDNYINETESQTQIEVNQIDDSGKTQPLFKGVVTQVQVRTVRDIYYLQVEAVSATYNLDIQVKSRSFQNINQKYTDLINQVIADYPGAAVNDCVSRDATTNQLIVQYLETDWQFLKRLAGHFYAPLIPASVFAEPKFYFGLPDGDTKGDLDNYHYSVKKKIGDYRCSTENFNQNLQETDFIYYQLETDHLFDLGDLITFKKRKLYVYEAITLMQQGIVKHNYLLTPQGGFSQNPVHNPLLIGASVQGQVIEVSKDKVRAHLEIDPEQAVETAYWFPYSSVYTAEGNSGWYCMPEIGDYIQVYFPDQEEKNAIASSSVRKDADDNENNKVGNPDIKYFRTKSGKELMFAPGEVLLSAKDGEIFIRLNDDNGIQIFSKRGIQLISKENLNIESQKKVVVSAKEGINLTCKASNIKMDGATTIKGSKVKTN